MSPTTAIPVGLPVRAGIGLRAPHHAAVLASWPDTGWLEVHSENFFGAGGEPLRVLEAVRERYPVSLHGVGLSLGSHCPPEQTHLDKLKALVLRIGPAVVSEHLCWSAVGGHHLNELLPLPYSREALEIVCANVSRTQDFLQRPILVENISSHIRFAGADYPEWEFVAEVAHRTGCGILLDVNNVWVSACNHGFDPLAYVHGIPPSLVGEIHLAGYEEAEAGGFLIDTHSRRVHEPVWDLYRETLNHCGGKPTLVEWDNDIPALDILLAEADRADRLLAPFRDNGYALSA